MVDLRLAWAACSWHIVTSVEGGIPLAGRTRSADRKGVGDLHTSRPSTNPA
jgi:hypothetical protein